MIKRRDLMKLGVVSAGVCLTSSVSACSWAEFSDDEWGARLIKFFKSGNEADLDGVIDKEAHLVAFEDYFIEKGLNSLYYQGEENVRAALQSFYQHLLKNYSDGRVFIDAQVVGSKQEGRMNKVELVFAEPEYTETSCGTHRSEISYDLFYEASVYETGEDYAKWAVKKLSIMPKFYEE